MRLQSTAGEHCPQLSFSNTRSGSANNQAEQELCSPSLPFTFCRSASAVLPSSVISHAKARRNSKYASTSSMKMLAMQRFSSQYLTR